MSFFGRHFPTRHFGVARHFPGDPPPGVPPTLGGVATFALVLDALKVTLAWETGMGKWWDGREARSNQSEDPAMRFNGEAVLVDGDLRALRGRLARYAALGRTFLLGLPYEELTLSDNATGTTVYVDPASMALVDWALPGVRVIIQHLAYGSWEGVIQSAAGGAIVVHDGIGDGPGNVGDRYARIMPAVPIYLEAQQGFLRYPNHITATSEDSRDSAEKWQLRARCAVAGVTSATVPATLALTTASGYLDGARFQARTPGAAGNSIVVTITNDAATAAGEFSEDTGLLTAHAKYYGATGTTVDAFAALINSSSTLIKMLGAWQGADLLQATDDVLGPSNLAGGADGTPVEAGVGATLTTYRDRIIWDRGIVVKENAQDSMQSLTEVKDMGGLPYTGQTASVVDWGRHFEVTGDLGEPFQFVKKFLYTVKGKWKSWWLPTSRADLIAVSCGVGTLTVAGGETAGDLSAWYPTIRTDLEVSLVDDTTSWVRITAAVLNGDGTHTLTIVDEDDNPVSLDIDDIEMVSWLEVCRFEKDIIDIDISGATFKIETLARAIQP